MEDFNKQYFIKQCHFCKYLEVKKVDIKTKDIYIQCCNKSKWHKITEFDESPKECPHYLERFMLSND